MLDRTINLNKLHVSKFDERDRGLWIAAGPGHTGHTLTHLIDSECYTLDIRAIRVTDAHLATLITLHYPASPAAETPPHRHHPETITVCPLALFPATTVVVVVFNFPIFLFPSPLVPSVLLICTHSPVISDVQLDGGIESTGTPTARARFFSS